MLKINLLATLLFSAILGFGPQAWSQTCSISPVGSTSQTVCQGTAITSVSFTSLGGNGAIFSGLPAGVTGSYNASTGEISISGTPTVAGNFNYFINLTGCSGGSTAGVQGVMVVTSSSAGILTGRDSICSIGGGGGMFASLATDSFISTVPGGTWSSSDVAIATVNSLTGKVNAISAGTVTITYTIALSGGCSGNATASKSLVVAPATLAGVLSGNASICTGGGLNTTLFSSTVAGGNWSSGNTSIATVNTSGLVTAVGAGSTRIFYTVRGKGGCGIDTVGRAITVTSFTAGTISGVDSICRVGGGSGQSLNRDTSTFRSTIPGGTWSSSNVAIAIVNSTSGLVTAVDTGSATITYTLPGSAGCTGSNATASRTVVVTAAPEAGTLDGTQALCIGGGTGTSQLTVLGNSGSGVWSSGNTSIATVNTSGLVTAVGAGSTRIFYTVRGIGGCGIDTVGLGIDVLPFRTISRTSAPLTDNQTLCVGSPIATITYLTTGATGATVTGLPNGVNGQWSGNVLTILGTPAGTLGGSFTYSVSLVGGCQGGNNQTASGTLLIRRLNSVALTTGSSSLDLCKGDSVGVDGVTPSLVYTTFGFSTGIQVTGLPVGMRAIYDSTARTTTINGIPTVRGTFVYRITALGGCTQSSGNTLTGTITVSGNTILLGKKDANLSTPDVVTNIQTRCALRPIQPVVFTTTGATGASLVPALPSNSGLSLNFNSGTGVITVSGTPDTAFTYSGVVRMSGGCTIGQLEPSVNITVLDSNIISLSSGSENQSVPRNTAMTDITFSTAGATGARFRGLPSGVTGTWSANTVTISGTPVATGTYRYFVDLVGGCPVGKGNSDTGTITVTAGGSLIGGGNGEQGFEGDYANRSNQNNTAAMSSGRLISNRGLITTMSVYPVPGSEFLYVRGLASLEQASLSILDQTGRVVLAPHTTVSKDASTGEFKLDLSPLADGVYFLRVQSATEGIDQMLRFSVKH